MAIIIPEFKSKPNVDADPECSTKEEGIYQHLLSESTIETDARAKSKLPSEEKLASDTLKIMKFDFHTLTTAVRLSLERREVSVKSLLGHLRSIEAVGPSFRPLYVDHSKPLKTVVAREFHSLEEVFVALAPYCSWFNHLIIENIIETFCEEDEDVQRKWVAFQDKVNRYCKHRVIECPEDQYGESDDESEVRKVVVMKVDYSWATVRIDQLFQVRNSVAKILDIKPFNLYLRTVEKGCIKMLFYTPNYAISNASLTLTTEIALRGIGVIGVTFGPEYAMPVKRRRLSTEIDYSIRAAHVPNLPGILP